MTRTFSGTAGTGPTSSKMLDRYLAALDDRADLRITKGLRDTDLWRHRNGELIDLVLDHPHWPRDLKLLDEHLTAVRGRLGERRRSSRNVPRLNSLLKLTLLDLRGQADEGQWARVLRENHLAHHGNPPPRRLIDGQLIKLP